MTTLRILSGRPPQVASTQSVEELHSILESSVERLSSGISFSSLHRTAAHSAVAVEQRKTNDDLIRAAEVAQYSMAVQEHILSFIDSLNNDLTALYGIAQRESDLKDSPQFTSTLERIKSRPRADDKIIPFTPELQWNPHALQIDLEAPREKVLTAISEAISLLAYAKGRAEKSISQSKLVMTKLLISRENKSAAGSATVEKLSALKGVYDE